MSAKRVSIVPRPTPPATADEWVGAAPSNEAPPAPAPVLVAAPAEPQTRLTIEIPTRLHRIIKSSCGARGTKMRDEIIVLLEAEFGKGTTP